MDPRYIPRVIYAGIDEAGYGPLLGPLCVGASAFRLADVRDASTAPDLWSLLSLGVCRKPKDARRRIAIADSKKLKSAGDQPLIHLERGVMRSQESTSLATPNSLRGWVCIRARPRRLRGTRVK